ncbi:MAG TPA: PQQ-dependent sugar dehydrogenase, partial [Candidatus Limnocylindria bacterium]|nr:PQQ-dependent sugar dehydrogenase [Candidatus Limnocylindria bacterium]
MRLRRLRVAGMSVLLALPLFGGSTGSVAAAPPSLTTAVVAEALAIPWDVAFLPNGNMLVTERIGRIRVYSTTGTDTTLIRTVGVPNVRAEGEAGLMGIAVDPDFASNGYVYVCASREYAGSGGWVNQLLRYTINSSDVWVGPTVVPNLAGIRANTIHNGCAVETDRFGHVWMSMGDANVSSRAQDRNSLNGKILRVNRDGSIPSDNPVLNGTRNAVYSMGHRNPQGIAIRPGTDQVYAAEHGPEPSHGDDEVNLIVPGGNYGWPCFTGAGRVYQTIPGCQSASAYLNPLWASGVPTLATSGAAFATGPQWQDYDGNLFVATLKESDVRRFSVNPAGTSLGGPTTLFNGTWGRLRAMVSGPGGQLYVTTSNGSNSNAVDRVVRISAAAPATGRVSGTDRYATAAALSAASFPAGSPYVIVATGTNYPDALAGSAVAGRFEWPVLLVRAGDIPGSTAAELDRLNPDTVYVLGGQGVISEAMRAQLATYASSGLAIRIAGADRYETAAQVSATWYAASPPAAFVATGTGFADALSGGPAAAQESAPLLLVRPNEVPPSTAAELARLQPARIYVLGGTGAVSAAVATQLDAYTAGPVIRLAGPDRYATAAAVARGFWLRE